MEHQRLYEQYGHMKVAVLKDGLVNYKDCSNVSNRVRVRYVVASRRRGGMF